MANDGCGCPLARLDLQLRGHLRYLSALGARWRGAIYGHKQRRAWSVVRKVALEVRGKFSDTCAASSRGTLRGRNESERKSATVSETPKSVVDVAHRKVVHVERIGQIRKQNLKGAKCYRTQYTPPPRIPVPQVRIQTAGESNVRYLLLV